MKQHGIRVQVKRDGFWLTASTTFRNIGAAKDWAALQPEPTQILENGVVVDPWPEDPEPHGLTLTEMEERSRC